MAGNVFSKDDLDRMLLEIKGKKLGEVDTRNVFDKTIQNSKITGIAGDVIQQSVLGCPADNEQRPDLCVDGVEIELKVTGVRQPNDEGVYEAKETMSITAVSVTSISREEFESSNFWHKLAHMLIVYYKAFKEKKWISKYKEENGRYRVIGIKQKD